MIGLVLVTHGRLADEFRAALEHVMGPQKQIEAVTIGAEDDSDLCRSDIIEAVNRVDSGDGVAILTDMFGGTPSNLAISCMSRPKVEVLAGINLPMLVKLAKVRETTSWGTKSRTCATRPCQPIRDQGWSLIAIGSKDDVKSCCTEGTWNSGEQSEGMRLYADS